MSKLGISDFQKMKKAKLEKKSKLTAFKNVFVSGPPTEVNVTAHIITISAISEVSMVSLSSMKTTNITVTILYF